MSCFGGLDHELPLRIQRTDTLTTQWEPPWLKH